MAEDKLELDQRDYNELEYALSAVSSTVYKEYYSELEDYAVLLPADDVLEVSIRENVKLFRLNVLEKEKGAEVSDKLTAIFQTATSLNNSVIILIRSNKYGKIDFYIGTKSVDKTKVLDSSKLLENAITTHFPGTDMTLESVDDTDDLIDRVFMRNKSQKCTISSVSGISIDLNNLKENDSRGINNFLSTMQGKVYSALFIIDPVRPEEATEMRKGYEQLYTSISPFEKSVWNYNSSDSVANIKSLTKGLASSVTESVGKTKGYSVSHMDSRFSSKTKGWNFQLGGTAGEGHQEAIAEMQGKSTSVNIPVGAIIKGVSLIGGAIAIAATGGTATPVVGAINAAISASGIDKTSINKGKSSSTTNTIADSISKSLTGSVSRNFSSTKGESESDGYTISDGINEVLSKGTIENEQETTGEQITESAGKSIQIEYSNKEIVDLLMLIEQQIQRLKESEDFGVFNVGAYFVSPYKTNSILAANVYKNIKQGKGSSNQNIAINTWAEGEREDDTKAIISYLSRFQQPVFLKILSAEQDEGMIQMLPYSAGSLISGAEIPQFIDFPSKSLYGIVVDEHVDFGHNQIEIDNKFRIGNLVGGNGLKRPVYLDENLLTSHVFITGSTGSGKSNAVYRMLQKCSEDKKHFLVIEPAKGEYKNILSQFKEIELKVFGVDPKKQDVLHLNPFAFDSKTVNVNIHIESLLTIFQVCWPLYAAMPSILRQAFEKAYVLCGWNLRKSLNPYGNIYPSFEDVKQAVVDIVNKSDYSDENKGNYKGSLCTRLDEMCTGLYRDIFSDNSEDISSELLVSDILVDLSDVNMPEHKSLLMGLIVLKLQEEHKRNYEGSELKHITVLEEAHHLLSKERASSSDGGNIAQRSVEMLTNAIAEMRSSGEAFIIADQAPALLDESIVRNTNTKILFNTSYVKDQEIVGKSIDLSDDQIGELSVLPIGRAIVFQRGWQEPILCDFDEHKYNRNKGYNYVGQSKKQSVDALFFNRLLDEKVVDKQLLISSSFSGISKKRILSLNYDESKDINELYSIISDKVLADIGCDSLGIDNNLNALRECLKESLELLYPGLCDGAIRLIEMIVMYSGRNKVDGINRNLVEYVDEIR